MTWIFIFDLNISFVSLSDATAGNVHNIRSCIITKIRPMTVSPRPAFFDLIMLREIREVGGLRNLLAFSNLWAVLKRCSGAYISSGKDCASTLNSEGVVRVSERAGRATDGAERVSMRAKRDWDGARRIFELDGGTNISAEKKGPTRPDPVVTVLSSFVWKVVFYVNLIFYIFRVNKSGDFKSK